MEKWKIQKVANVCLNATAVAAGAATCVAGAGAGAAGVAGNVKIEALSDKDLYALCKEYGGKARKWLRKFAFLLPEVARRGLHRKYKCESIYEFSAKLAGMSHEVVYRVLSLHAKLKGMPKLWELLKTQGWGKLQLIAAIARPETENYWADKVSTMARCTLQLFIHELKKQGNLPGQARETTLFENFVTIEKGKNEDFVYSKPEIAGAPNFCNENLEGKIPKNSLEKLGENSLKNFPELQSTFRKLKFNVDAGTEISLRMFKQELEKARKEAITMGEALRALLEIAELAKMLSKCMPKEYRSMFPYWRA